MADNITRLVRALPDVRYTETEVARMVGMSVDTVRRWRRSGKISPTDTMQVGHLQVYLYSEDDIKTIRGLKGR